MDFTSKIELQSFPDNMTLDTCSEGFVQCFLRVPRLLGCTAAAMLPKQARETFIKPFAKLFSQPDAADCRWLVTFFSS